MANKYIKDLNTTTSPSLTGYTIYENGVSTSKTSLETLKDTIVDGLSHTFEGDQTIKGDLIVSGSIISQQYIISSSITNIITETISGSSNFGNTDDDNHNFTGSVNITGSLSLNGSQINISGSGSHLAYFDTPTSLTSSNTLHILNGGTSLGVGIDVVSSNEGEYYERLIVDGYDTHNIATFQNSFGDHYGAVNIINWNTGSHASADLVLMNSDSDESSSYVNLGINSVHHTDLSCGYAGDAYLVNFSNDMYIGSMAIAGISGHGHTHLFSAGAWRNPGISMYNDTTIGFFTEKQSNQRFSIPSSSQGFKVEFSGSVKMDNNLKVDGWVSGSYFVGDGSMLTNLPSGLDGTSGTSGTSGVNGTSGTSGSSGSSGISGIDGTSGTSGTSGIDGTSGTSGIDGTSGSSGTSGIDGTSGSSGTSGIDGTSGTSGVDGTSGSSGTSGIDGTSGTSGIDGTSGSSGTSGIDGTSGSSGTSGIDGTSGTSGDSIFTQTGSSWSTTNDIEVTGSLNVSGTTISDLLKLNAVSTLPINSTFGDMAVSGSNLYFHNGTSWRKIQLEPTNNILVNNISGPIVGSFSATGVTFNESFPLSSGSTITGIGTIVPGDSLPMVISGNQNYLVQFYKNGSMILDSSGTGPSTIGFTSNFNITSNDNLEIRITTY